MTPDETQLIGFYKSPLGRMARSLLREEVRRLAGDVREKRVLGIGFATPYMRAMLEPAERVMALMPARQGASSWPREGPSCTALCDLHEMPLTDSSIDLIIAIHAFEHDADAAELMREIWRIAAPNAELIIIVPRRRGLWAQRDNTPFGFGHPYSRSQMDDLLRSHSFSPVSWRDVLYLPPSNSKGLLNWARLFERAGRLFGSTFAGAMCVKAKKELFPAVIRRQRSERFVRVPELKPQTAMNHPVHHPLTDR